MRKHIAIIGIVTILGLCKSSYGLTTEWIGPSAQHPAAARPDWPAGIIEIPRHKSRVYSTCGGFGNENFYFKCKVDEINELLAIFSKARMRDHVVRIEPGIRKAKTFFSKEQIEYNVHLRVVWGIALDLARNDRSRKALPLEPRLTILTGDDKSIIKQLKWPKNLFVESKIRGVSINKGRKKPILDPTDQTDAESRNEMVNLNDCDWTVTAIRSAKSIMREQPACVGFTEGVDEEFKPERGQLSIITVTLKAGKTGDLDLVPELFIMRDGGIYGVYHPCRGLRVVDPKPGVKVAAFHPPSDGRTWPGHAGWLGVTKGQPVTIELAFTQIVRNDAELLVASPAATLSGLK